ncbi:MAG: GNAT family N-acetyltransferase [Clostridium sp.]
MYTKSEILDIAKKQLSLDYSCNITNFEEEKNTVVENIPFEGRRIYDNDGCLLRILCIGGKSIISASPEFIPWCEEKLVNRSADWLFQYPTLRGIDNKLQELGHEIADIHHYYLPNGKIEEVQPIRTIRWYEREEILQFEDDDRFEEAFAFDENHPDMIAVAALDGEKIIGMAGASADSETMWQIGIDVMNEYRGKGIAKNLVMLLKNEVLKRGKIPFYGTVESHLNSQKVAISSGFIPAWAELYSQKK